MAPNLRRNLRGNALWIFLLIAGLRAADGMAAEKKVTPGSDTPPVVQREVPTKPVLDRSGKPRKGKASYYGRRFYGKKMASGKPMNPNSNVAASKTLPLGTKAKVTNLKTGKSAVVDIQDRGPYVKGRIVDLSPKTAEDLDIKEEGVVPVEVKPIVIPPPTENKPSPKTPEEK